MTASEATAETEDAFEEGTDGLASQQQQAVEEKPTKYAWFVLFLIFAVRAIH